MNIKFDNGDEYCPDALWLLGKRVICGKNCPLLTRCPRIILEEATDAGIEKAIRAIKEALVERAKDDTCGVDG